MGAIIYALDTIDPCKMSHTTIWQFLPFDARQSRNPSPGQNVLSLALSIGCTPLKPWDLILVQHDLFRVRKIVWFCSRKMNLQFAGRAAVVVATVMTAYAAYAAYHIP